MPSWLSEQDRLTLQTMLDHVNEQFIGGRSFAELSLACLLAEGHLLLEGPPGAGKTSLARALATAAAGSFQRVQMTSDLLPSDLTGILRVDPKTQDFEFRPGPIFANVVLIDELNRSSPKTQSALLEAMAEHQITVDGKTHALPKPFLVVATQNPFESQGVYALVESQLDRFALCLTIPYPDRESELAVYESALHARPPALSSERRPPFSLDQTRRLQELTQSIHLDLALLEFTTALIRKTREDSEILQGASPRAGLQLLATARALALVRGHEFVRPREILDLAVPCLAHRLQFQDGEGDTQRRVEKIRAIMTTAKAPQ